MPDGFRFAVKMPRAITVFGRVDDVPAFCERVRALGDRLGPLLVRPADDRKRDDGFLRALLDGIDDDLWAAFDLRDPSWDGVEALLEGRDAVRVNQLDAPAPFRYLRLREPPYDDAALSGVGGSPAPAARRRPRGALLLHARGRADGAGLCAAAAGARGGLKRPDSSASRASAWLPPERSPAAPTQRGAGHRRRRPGRAAERRTARSRGAAPSGRGPVSAIRR